MTKSTITINGRVYDAITGMPVLKAPAAENTAQQPKMFTEHPKAVSASRQMGADFTARPPHEVHAPAQAVHQATQRSHTLYRQALQRPVVTHQAERSSHISKFHAEPAAPTTQPTAHHQIEAPIQNATVHPTVAKVLQQAQPVQQLTGSDLKEQLIKERLAEVADAPVKKEGASWLSRQPRLVTILSSTLALLILGGYLTYITLPSISLKVAASRAGVNASMPEYKPDGYSLDGPITYSPGEVVISYKSNTNEAGYKIIQKATNWDSQAVLDNYVNKLADNYLTFQEKGITVYTFGNKAAWVNGGLLYTIDGDAALSSDQILKVATSI
jgi:hypothetical protein